MEIGLFFWRQQGTKWVEVQWLKKYISRSELSNRRKKQKSCVWLQCACFTDWWHCQCNRDTKKGFPQVLRKIGTAPTINIASRLSQTTPTFPLKMVKKFCRNEKPKLVKLRKVIRGISGTDYSFRQLRSVGTSLIIQIHFFFKISEKNHLKHRPLSTQGSLLAIALALNLIGCNCSWRAALEPKEAKLFGRLQTVEMKAYIFPWNLFLLTSSINLLHSMSERWVGSHKNTIIQRLQKSTFGGMKNAKHGEFQRKVPKLI